MTDQPQTALADGGPAFPADSFAAQHCPGMSLRDWFVGQIVGAIFARHDLLEMLAGSSRGEENNGQVAGRIAYEFADAMLEARMLEHEANGGSNG